jgi:hypothetical protein
MTKRTALVSCTAIMLAAAIAACSSSTSPSSSSGNNPKPPSSASKGDSVNLTGTYDLAMFVFDSTDGGSASSSTDANDGATLTLNSTGYSLTWTGSFLTNGNQNTHGSYEAVDTSSTAQRGTIALYDSVKARTQNGTYAMSNDTLTVSIPDGGGNGTDITIFIKQ